MDRLEATMVSLNLSQKEADVLRDVLTQQHNRLLMEIANTDVREYRDSLKERETIVRKITDQLDGSRTER
jgi:NurA-like 5'-3' nuclease